MNSLREKVLVCSCHSKEHQIWFSYFSDEPTGEREMYVSTHLSPLGFFSRLVYAVKYLFGYQSEFGAFSELVLFDQQIADLEDFFLKYRNEDVV